MKKVSNIIKKFLPVVLIGILAFTSGCSGKPSSNAVVVTVDDARVRMSEMNYYIMLAEMQGELYASYIGSGENYWDMKNDDGSTIRDTTKDMAMDNAIKYELFYKLAIQEGYKLTDADKESDQKQVDSIIKSVEKEQFDKTGLTESNLLEIEHKINLATKYYDNYMKSLGVDETAIKAEYKQSDYKQYDIEYIFAPKDEKPTLTELFDQAKEAEDLTSLTTGTDLNSGKLSFLAGANTFGEEDNLEGIITAMKVGEVKGDIETVKGCYIIKLKDNTSTSKYDDAVKEAVKTAETKAFDTAFSELKKEHKISVKNSVWNKVVVGNTIVTASK
jgi:foldase protein PrsA